MTEKEVETETWTEGEEQNEVVDGFQIEIYSISLPVMDATQDSVVLPWIVCLFKPRAQSMDATSLCLGSCILF